MAIGTFAIPTILYQVDSFTDTPFAGNPAGVCILPVHGDEEWMQQVAREMNLSETAFLNPEIGGYHLRWFTPIVEVDLCGHATLASAHILWETGDLKADRAAHFHTASGPLTARKDGKWIYMEFPAIPPEDMAPPKGLGRALDIKPVYMGQNRLDLLVVVETAGEVRGLHPDFTQLRDMDSRGVIVTAPSDQPEYDFISRAFFPALGIDEDPVTGSAHCCLGPYWSERLGRKELVGYQSSPRGGVVKVEVRGDRVLLGGQAVTVMKIEML
ncbi:MAG: PhzF family phenazine biosynthesis protein [Fidelibacterota bacterium]|nr:MAG: PhzF family phenazine biosynthesis protein [Candidatus Neomarinimicrobiota bacterium]